MVNIAPDFPIEDSSREPRGIEHGLQSLIYLTRCFSPPTLYSFVLVFCEWCIKEGVF